MILHHTGVPRELAYAQVLAEKAAASNYPNARWLWAAIYDRRMVMRGRPQKYGTQFTIDAHTGKIMLRPVDGSCSDGERIALGLPTLREVHGSLETQNERPRPKLQVSVDDPT